MNVRHWHAPALVLAFSLTFAGISHADPVVNIPAGCRTTREMQRTVQAVHDVLIRLERAARSLDVHTHSEQAATVRARAAELRARLQESINAHCLPRNP